MALTLLEANRKNNSILVRSLWVTQVGPFPAWSILDSSLFVRYSRCQKHPILQCCKWAASELMSAQYNDEVSEIMSVHSSEPRQQSYWRLKTKNTISGEITLWTPVSLYCSCSFLMYLLLSARYTISGKKYQHVSELCQTKSDIQLIL